MIAEIMMTAVLTAAACAVPGVFLVLRGMSMMSDSITHTILLGIVLGFLASGDLSSPLLVAGAALTGLATVWLTELVKKTGLVSGDSAIGIVFPLMFSVAVILITRYAGSAHLDTDMVLLGELAFSPLERVVVGGMDIGSKAMVVSLILLVVNLLVVLLFFKELKLAAFDPALGALLGFAPAAMHYLIMTMTSVTAVCTFETSGSILVVAFMIAPPAAASLLTDKLTRMLGLSVGIAALSGVSGFCAAYALDTSISGCTAAFCGIYFFAALMLSPKNGLVASFVKRYARRRRFEEAMVLFAVNKGTYALCRSYRRVMKRLVGQGLVHQKKGLPQLTDRGALEHERLIMAFFE